MRAVEEREGCNGDRECWERNVTFGSVIGTALMKQVILVKNKMRSKQKEWPMNHVDIRGVEIFSGQGNSKSEGP